MTEQMMYPPMMIADQSMAQAFAAQKKIVDTLTTLIDVESWLDYIDHNLRGEKFDPTRGERGEFVKVGERLMNDLGVEAIITELRFRISASFILTNLELDEIYRIARETRLGIINLLYMNAQHYNIDPSRMTNIVNMVDHAVFAVLKRSYHETTLKVLKETITRIENSFSDGRQTKGGIKL